MHAIELEQLQRLLLIKHLKKDQKNSLGYSAIVRCRIKLLDNACIHNDMSTLFTGFFLIKRFERFIDCLNIMQFIRYRLKRALYHNM